MFHFEGHVRLLGLVKCALEFLGRYSLRHGSVMAMSEDFSWQQPAPPDCRILGLVEPLLLVRDCISYLILGLFLLLLPFILTIDKTPNYTYMR